MNVSLLEYLQCVDCEGEQLIAHSIQSNANKQIVTGYVTCESCQSHFPIIHGVLITFKKEVIKAFLLPEELDVIEKFSIPIMAKDANKSSSFVDGQVRTHHNWSFQWLEMDTRTYGKDWGKSFGDLEKFHYYDIPVPPEMYNNKIICEASCGFGRVIQILHEQPSRYIAFDLSGAVYKAIKLFPDSEKLDVIRTDILCPPFKKESFDMLFSPRALHHTGDMNRALDKVIPLIKKGGILAYSVYSREHNFLMWGIVEPLKRIMNKIIPRSLLLGISSVLGIVIMGIIHLMYVPLDKLHLKILPLHKFFLVWSGFSFTTIRMNIFDLLHAPYAEYISDSQIKEWEKTYRLTPIAQNLLHDTVWGYAAQKGQ